MSTQPTFPKWLKVANRLIIALNYLGIGFGTWSILSIPGRKTGKMRSTPVSVLHVNGRRYVVTGFETQWVKNARQVGWGTLRRGWKKEKVAVVELPVEERGSILREFPRQVPHGVAYFEKLLNLPGNPEAFAAAAPRCPAFRLDPLEQTTRDA
ncbi:hypothetical protein [Dictyobacter formicarum]|uniref:Nitroreductase n=1 Tax=Dictyobacter formicarum TaxID=2778368 RepID=A0ABQ3VMS4_9CHLR|nr:hypothetical protein [Dictyobacter formicarum]GHO87142.1 hypothetical protein KSZ_51480 [Dictyobacter formicarum]